jgi:hypothetical protein
MNGFAEHGLDEGAFGEKTGNIVKAFDAFREFHFIQPSACGRYWGKNLFAVHQALLLLTI